MVSTMLMACGVAGNGGVGQPSASDDESVGSASQAITAACNLNTIGLPCDPDGPAKPLLECEGVCAIALTGLVACQAVKPNALDGVVCGTSAGVGDAACKRHCSGKACLATNAPAGSACRPTSKATPCDGMCDGSGSCGAIGASACDFGRNDQLCTFATCNFKNASECKTALLLKNTLCSDANACSIARCDAKGACTAGATVGCDDGNACTDDSCDAQDGGCVGVNNDANKCSDSNACTEGDYCSSGGCIAGTPKVCDDADLCTKDSCDPNTGCAFVPKCADADACTDDVCDPSNGGCSHPAKSCDDNDACTIDACDSATGCTHTALDCDDNDPCTADSCGSGACVHEAIVDCGVIGVGGAGGSDGGGTAGEAAAGETSVGGTEQGGTGGTEQGGTSGTEQGGTSGTEQGGTEQGGTSATAGTAGTDAVAGNAVGASSNGGSGNGSGATTSTAGSAGSLGSAGDPSLPDGDTNNTSSGCGCRTAGAPTNSGPALALLGLLGLAVARRRRAA